MFAWFEYVANVLLKIAIDEAFVTGEHKAFAFTELAVVFEAYPLTFA